MSLFSRLAWNNQIGYEPYITLSMFQYEIRCMFELTPESSFYLIISNYQISSITTQNMQNAAQIFRTKNNFNLRVNHVSLSLSLCIL